MLEALFEAPELDANRGAALPRAVRLRHGGEFALLDSTRLYSNFVSTLDGVVELGDPGVSSGSAISGRNDDDRFLMSLLRAFADFIVVGAGTFNAEPQHAWTAEAIYPALAEELRELRVSLGRPAQPTLLVATRSGAVNRDHAAFGAQPVVVLADVTTLPAGIVLTEGGPHLMGSLAGRVDEVFLTLAPVLAGRSGKERLGMVEGVEMPAPRLLQHRLLSVRRGDSMLFARYQRIRV